MREAILDIKGTLLDKSVQILAHLDDNVVIVERYGNSVNDAFNRLELVHFYVEIMPSKTFKSSTWDVCLQNTGFGWMEEKRTLSAFELWHLEFSQEINRLLFQI